jgi:hypothetical protein
VTELTNDKVTLGSDPVSRERTITGTPYLSVVATARNDDHGGDLLARMRAFAHGLAAQCERHCIEAELIVVEWNPPADRVRLADAFEWPDTPWCPIRIIEVPHELHVRLEHADRLPLFQMIAKNVGIRRARGEFVLATNIDILFSDELMQEIASRRLSPNHVYRVDRHDAAVLPDPATGVARMLEACDRNVVRICTRLGTTDLATDTFYRIYENEHWPLFARRLLHFARALIRRKNLYTDLAARRWRRHREYLASLRELAAFRWKRPVSDGAAANEGVNIRATAVVARHMRPPRPRVHLLTRAATTAQWLQSKGETLAITLARVKSAWHAEAALIPLHTNASGDFTLLSRAGWASTRGYAELEIFSMHLDGLFLYQAHYAGYPEVELPGRIFHIEHTHGFKPDPAEVHTLNQRLERCAIPQVTGEQFRLWIYEMYRTRTPLRFNDETWGLADVDLPETSPAPQVREVAAR